MQASNATAGVLIIFSLLLVLSLLVLYDFHTFFIYLVFTLVYCAVPLQNVRSITGVSRTLSGLR